MPYAIELEGLRALVTGGGQGVGRGIARALGEAGARVMVNDFVEPRAASVAAEIAACGGSAGAVAFDVTDYSEVLATVDREGPFDILVNNAGNAGTSAFSFPAFVDTSPDDWKPYIDVNLWGVMHCTRAVLPGMIERQAGRVVTIISDAGRWGEPKMAAYAAAKAGAAGFCRSIAREVGRHGITVNAVALGTIDAREDGDIVGAADHEDEQVGRSPSSPSSEQRDRMLRGYIVRRLGRPADVAGLVTYLVSPAASWITGQTYPVNGGYTVNQ